MNDPQMPLDKYKMSHNIIFSVRGDLFFIFFTSALFSYLPHLSLSFQATVSWDLDRRNSDHAR